MLHLYPRCRWNAAVLAPCVVVVTTIFFESVVATVNELARDESWGRAIRFMAPTAALIILVAGCVAQSRAQPSIEDEETRTMPWPG